MHRTRLLAMTVQTAIGFMLVQGQGRIRGQTKPMEPLTGAMDSQISEMKKGEKKFDTAKARQLLNDLMKHYVGRLTHPDMFSAARELRPGTDLPMDATLSQFKKFVLAPEPNQKYTPDQADYIKEFGEAFVVVFKPLLESNVERIVRLNAARMLSEAAKCGAPAFAPLITNLIASANTPGEVKYYALKAVEGFLAAHDIVKLASPNVMHDHTIRAPELAALLSAIEATIFDPTKIITFPPGVDPKQAPPEIGSVVAYIRRQAIRAYAQTRFASLDLGDGKMMYPAFVLARVALSDSSLSPKPGPAETAEAAIGLCGMQPDKNFMLDAAADAVATGILTFARTLTMPSEDNAIRVTPWKLYGAKLKAALLAWKSGTLSNVAPNLNPQAAIELVDLAVPSVLNALEREGAAGRTNQGFEIRKLDQYRQALRANPKTSKLLFRGVEATSLAPLQK